MQRSSAKFRDPAPNSQLLCFSSAGEAGNCRPGRLAPLIRAPRALKKSRPLSRVLSWTVIPLGCASPRSSSDLPGSPMRATWCGRQAPRASLFGLAPGGVCRAADVATRAVRSYRTISPLPAPLARHLGGIFLLHFPWARAPQALPGTVPLGARTFLHVLAHTATAWPTLKVGTIRRSGYECEADSCLSCKARL
jgi:hypothetical protein